jgi:hypothetical protein
MESGDECVPIMHYAAQRRPLRAAESERGAHIKSPAVVLAAAENHFSFGA